MKKFAANYLVSDTEKFLKNGIVVATETGVVVEFIDTDGDLREIAQLSFFNGILMANFRFVRNHSGFTGSTQVPILATLYFQQMAELDEANLQNIIEIGKKIQVQFPELTIPQIFMEISNWMLLGGRFSRIQLPGLFLISGVDLSNLKFTHQSKLKKIL
jgi:hypothetical protein